MSPHLLLTELRPTGTLFAGKEILTDGSIKERPLIKHWKHRQVGFDNIKQLRDYVVATQYGNCIIIRGFTETTNRIVLRRNQHFIDRHAALLPLDIDDVAIGPWVSSPRKAVDGIVRRLGEPFVSTS